MTVDVEKLVESHMNGRTGQCQTCRWLSLRPTDEQVKWDKVMADILRYPHSAIHRAILAATEADFPGPAVGRASVENHRNNGHRK